MSRTYMSRTRADSGGISCKSEVTNCMAYKDGEKDITIVVHSEQHPTCQRGREYVKGERAYTRKETVN